MGNKHDLRLFKDSKTYLTKDTKLIGDKGYIGIAEIHKNSQTPLKNSKAKPLTKEEKRRNWEISQVRITVEHVICCLKRFKIISDRYRNRRKRFKLRFNLIAGIYNFEL
jgi:hypothetical protein